MTTLQRWSSPSIPQEDRRRFMEEVITPGNLRRMFWLIVLFFPVSLGFLIHNLASLHVTEVDPWLFFDLGLAIVFFAANRVAMRNPGSYRWNHGLVVAYYVYCLVSMDGYYFAAMPRFGENAAYVLGVMMTAVIFRLPPRSFFTLLLGNHAIFTALVLLSERSQESKLSAMIAGLDAIIVACLASWFLFANEWKNFRKEEIIAKTNRQLIAANARLRQNNEEMNEIMAVAAHELRSPLYGLQSLFEMEMDSSEWQREPYAPVVRVATKGVKQMLDRLDHMIKAHEAEYQLGELTYEEVDLREFLSEGAEQMRPLAARKEIRLDLSLPATAAMANISIPTFARVFDNLLSNAIKFAPCGSVVRIVLRRDGEWWRGEVHDTGPGIAVEDREKLFRKFQSGPNLPTGGEASSGLGLFIASKLMNAMNGSLEYRAGEQGGSTFIMAFPALAQEG